MSPNPAPLPATVSAEEDEAGMSFVLRTLASNCLTFGRARTWLGLRKTTGMGQQYLRTLAWATGADPRWLQYRCLERRTEGGMVVCRLLGHTLRPSMLARERWVQLCPACVHEDGYCQSTWDVACVCACVRHSTLLVDRCLRCERRLEWDRPTVDVCKCGRLLIASGKAPALHPYVSLWCEWVQRRLRQGADAAMATPSPLPAWLGQLSVDGAFRVVHAFGVVRPSTATLASFNARLMPISLMAELIESGVARLQHFDDPERRLDWAREVHVPGLVHLTKVGVTDADRSAAANLIELITHPAKARPDGRGGVPRGQLSLFQGLES